MLVRVVMCCFVFFSFFLFLWFFNVSLMMVFILFNVFLLKLWFVIVVVLRWILFVMKGFFGLYGIVFLFEVILILLSICFVILLVSFRE